MRDFISKVAVITGAGSGMGRYLAVLLAKSGCDVVICDVNEDTLAGTASMLKNYNVAVSRHVLDVGDAEAIKALPEKVIAQHGKVDLVFNNAGITIDSDFANMPEPDWDKVMDVNLHGVINMTRAFFALFERSSRGCCGQYIIDLRHDRRASPERLSRDEVCRAWFYRELGERNEGHLGTGALRASRAHRHEYSDRG